MDHSTPMELTTTSSRGPTTGVAPRPRVSTSAPARWAALGAAVALTLGCGQGTEGSPGTPSPSPTLTTPTPTRTLTPTPTDPPPTLEVPRTAALPAERFRVKASSTSGAEVSISAGPSEVCRVSGTEVRLRSLGVCTVSASAGGLTTEKAVQVVKGRPEFSWNLRKKTPHSRALRSHGIRSTSDAQPTYRSLTPTQCRIEDNKILALADRLENVASLGPCKVRVEVAETPMWEAARTTLSTTIVEATVSIAFKTVPETVTVGEDVTVVVELTHRDSSIDSDLAVVLSGCGAVDVRGNPDADSEEPRLVSLSFDAAAPKGTTECTLEARTAINGVLKVVSSDTITETVGVDS